VQRHRSNLRNNGYHLTNIAVQRIAKFSFSDDPRCDLGTEAAPLTSTVVLVIFYVNVFTIR